MTPHLSRPYPDSSPKTIALCPKNSSFQRSVTSLVSLRPHLNLISALFQPPTYSLCLSAHLFYLLLSNVGRPNQPTQRSSPTSARYTGIPSRLQGVPMRTAARTVEPPSEMNCALNRFRKWSDTHTLDEHYLHHTHSLSPEMVPQWPQIRDLDPNYTNLHSPETPHIYL